MKVFRKVAEPTFYGAVAHDGPRPLASGLLNTFPVSIPVESGDLVGLFNASGSGTAPLLSGTPADTWAYKTGGGLKDGDSGPFTTATNARLNISAVFVPTNTFTLGVITRNRRKGTATITAKVPNPGKLTASGKGVKGAGAAVTSKVVTTPGKVKLRIRAKGRKKRTLLRTGRVKLKVRITYTPTGGDPRIRSRKVTLKKRL
jgi:hypothetical protein